MMIIIINDDEDEEDDDDDDHTTFSTRDISKKDYLYHTILFQKK